MNKNDPGIARIAVVGCGEVTKVCHVPAALRSRHVEVAALVDNNLPIAQGVARTYGLRCRVAKRLEDVLDGVQGVLVATPNHTHHAVAKAALERSLPVLIEKPIATRHSDALELCELAERKGTFIAVGYFTRFYPSVRLMKRLLESGHFGRIRGFSYEFGNAGGWAPVSGYNLDRAKAGGGVLMVSGSHFMDRMLHWFGEPRETSYADDSHGGVEANCRAELRYDSPAGGFTGRIALSKTIALKNRFVLETDAYRCEIPESQSESVTVFPHSDPELRMELYPGREPPRRVEVDYYQRQLEEFARNIREGGPVTADGRSAAASLKLMENLYARRTPLAEPWIPYAPQAR